MGHDERGRCSPAGAVSVKAAGQRQTVDPDTGERQRFSSAILPAWARKVAADGRDVAVAVSAWLSTSDFGPALEQFLGSGRGLSARRSPDGPPVAGRGKGLQAP